MHVIIDSYKKGKALHHAYVIEGQQEYMYPQICQFCEKELQFQTKANPDFYFESFERFSIADARRLHEMQMRKTTDRGRKIFIVAFTFITKEAQNALLKVLEEPTEGTHFFFITQNTKVLLDTVLSRVIVVSSGTEDAGEVLSEKDAEKFLKASYKDRLAFVTKLVTDIKNEKKSRSDALLFVQSLQRALHTVLQKKPNTEIAHGLKAVHQAEGYMHDQGSSVKQLLEHLSLVVEYK